MNTSFKEKNMEFIVPGCVVLTNDGHEYLVVENELQPPCACSEAMGVGYILIDLNKNATTYEPYNVTEIRDMDINRVIQPEKIVIKEL